jgi:hypothetical protein
MPLHDPRAHRPKTGSSSISPTEASVLSKRMSPPILSTVGATLLFASSIYCLMYNSLSGQPEAFSESFSWALANAVPWVLAFEICKRLRNSDAESAGWRWPLAATILLLTTFLSIVIQQWLLPEKELSSRILAFAFVRRIPPAALVCLLLLAAWAFRGRACAQVAVPAPKAASELPLFAQQIDWITAAGNYVEIRSGQRLTLRRTTMADAEALLRSQNFLRIHRSLLINVNRVRHYSRGKLTDEVTMEDGTLFKIGGAYRSFVAQMLSDHNPPASR